MTKVSWHRNPKIRSLLAQFFVLALLFILVLIVVHNAHQNMDSRGIQVSTWFLWTESPFKVGFTPFWEFRLGETRYWEIFVIGIQNTLLVGIAGIVGATFLGFMVGIARLSENWFAASAAAVFVEVFRNVPLLLQVFFWYFVVILPLLPNPRDGISLRESVFLNNKGLFTPAFSLGDDRSGLLLFGLSLVAAITAIIALSRWAGRRFELTARRVPVFWISLIILAAAVYLGYIASQNAIQVDLPSATRFGFSGGFWVPIPLFSLWLALVCYTGAFIAENVRAGIQSVSGGQLEAARSLGLNAALSMKLILVPQALRVIIPPTISQYLNLVKNSSLAIAVGYDDLVNIWMGITLNQTGQAMIIIAMTMAVFTIISLLTSWLMNLYDRRTRLIERQP